MLSAILFPPRPGHLGPRQPLRAAIGRSVVYRAHSAQSCAPLRCAPFRSHGLSQVPSGTPLPPLPRGGTALSDRLSAQFCMQNGSGGRLPPQPVPQPSVPSPRGRPPQRTVRVDCRSQGQMEQPSYQGTILHIIHMSTKPVNRRRANRRQILTRLKVDRKRHPVAGGT